MDGNEPVSRRRLVRAGVAAAAAAFLGKLAAAPAAVRKAAAPAAAAGEEETPPAEDLMREHGVLNRLLLLYESAIPSLKAGDDRRLRAVGGAADLMRRFVEDYHERLEEEHLFPRFEKAGKLKALVGVLRAQHDAGRRLTEAVQGMARSRDRGARKPLAEALRLYVRMYRPHEAREDTVLFPAFKELVPRAEYEALGESFEKRERDLFGRDGFQAVVQQVAELERAAGVYELAQFTPPGKR